MLFTKRSTREKDTEQREKFLEELVLLRQEVVELRTLEKRRLQAEAERNAAEARFARLLDTSMDAIIAVDENLSIVLFNQGAQQTFGYNAEEAIGQPLDLLISPRFVEMHRDHIRKFAESSDVARFLHAYHGVVGQRKNGTEFPAEASISKLKKDDHTFFFVVMRDITENKRIEEALRESERRYRQLLSSVTDYIYTVRFENGRPVETQHGPNCVAVTGYTSTEYGANPFLWYQMIHEEDRHLVMTQTEKLEAGEYAPPIEHRIIHKDGSVRWVRNTTVLRKNEQGNVSSYDGLITDITVRKQLQERLEAIYGLGQELTLLLDEMAIASRVLETAANVLQFKSAGYGLVDEATRELEYRCHLVDGVLYPDRLRVALEGGEFWDVGVEVVHRGRLLSVPDTQHAPRYASGRWSGRSELCVPIKIGDRVLGVLKTAGVEPYQFTADDQKLLQALADQTAVAIENARLYDEVHQRVNELTRLNEQAEMLRQATAALTSTLDLNQVLESILTHLKKVVDYDSACVFLWEEEGLRAVASRGLPEEEQVTGSLYPAEPPALSEIEGNNHALTLTSVLHGIGDIDYVPGWLTVSLKVRGKIIGYLTLDSRRSTTYDQNEAALTQAFANQAAVAIQNAQLYQAERERHRQLQQSQSQLIHAEKMAALGRLVASVAHEVNNPLQATQNSLALLELELENHQRQEKVAHHLGVARDEIERISSIVNRMLEFYSLRQQKQSSQDAESTVMDDFYRCSDDEMRALNLHEILNHVLQLTNKQMQHSNVYLEHLWANDLPQIQGNPDYLKQVFLNLVLNATDAMSQSGGTLRVSTAVIQARFNGHLEPMVRIEFSDTGAGMTPEALSRVFEPTFTTKEHGSGLGLFVCYKIIEAHRGQINVESHLGLGTTFTIFLPLEQS